MYRAPSWSGVQTPSRLYMLNLTCKFRAPSSALASKSKYTAERIINRGRDRTGDSECSAAVVAIWDKFETGTRCTYTIVRVICCDLLKLL